ncbi:MAG: hypothetical protein ACREMW_06205 [Gemmatimonadales bacterium]
MKRTSLSTALVAALAACFGGIEPVDQSRLALSPVLDTLFVADLLPPRQVTFYDANGTVQDPGVVQWLSADTSVLTVDATGRITGRKAGSSLVLASARGVQGSALVAVLGPLHVTLLLDSVYLMPGDTFTMPVQVDHQAAGTPTVWFTAATNAVFDVDSASGRDSAKAPGGPIPLVVHAVLNADTVADTGTVEVVQLTDTIGGKASFAMFGSVIRSRKATARALNFHRRGDTLTFRLRVPTVQGSTTVEAVVITLQDAPTAPGSFAIDSISPAEVSGQYDPFCRPPRSWGLWSVLTSTTRLDALSRVGGSLTITRMVPVANGMAISGRFSLPAQRVDLYDDPLGVLPMRGTFVAPLITTTPRCE